MWVPLGSIFVVARAMAVYREMNPMTALSRKGRGPFPNGGG